MRMCAGRGEGEGVGGWGEIQNFLGRLEIFGKLRKM